MKEQLFSLFLLLVLSVVPISRNSQISETQTVPTYQTTYTELGNCTGLSVEETGFPRLPDELCAPYTKSANLTETVIVNASTYYTDQVGKAEGNYPIYILVFADEEARAKTYYISDVGYVGWKEYLKDRIEAADTDLLYYFSQDLRILDFLPYESDNNIPTLSQLLDDLQSKTQQYLQLDAYWYSGPWWADFVDAVVGFSEQCPNDPYAGVCLAEKSTIIITPQVYWEDDNIIKHEVSHFFNCDDHTEETDPCCTMSYHTHYVEKFFEGEWWDIYSEIPCAATCSFWCGDCNYRFSLHRFHFMQVKIEMRTDGHGSTYPSVGIHWIRAEQQLVLKAYPDWTYAFDNWEEVGLEEHYPWNPYEMPCVYEFIMMAHFCPGWKLEIDFFPKPDDGVGLVYAYDRNGWREGEGKYYQTPAVIYVRPNPEWWICIKAVTESYTRETCAKGGFRIYKFSHWSINDYVLRNPTEFHVYHDNYSLKAYYSLLPYSIR